MSHSKFVHLHVHSQYSLLDGACRIKDLVQKAIDYQMPAVTITDHGNLFGAIDFFKMAKKMGIKPIIGCEAYLSEGSRLDKTPKNKSAAHLVLLAKNEIGYKNLLRLVSSSYTEGFYYSPRMDKEILSKYSEGLLCTSACLKGSVAQHVLRGNYNEALKTADEFNHIFGKGNFYLEIMDHGIAEQKKANEGIIKVSKELNIPLVVTNDVHYLEQHQSAAHDALLCIQTQTMLSDTRRMSLSTDQFYFKSPQQMYKEFNFIETALTNTVEIAEKCSLDFKFGVFHLPKFECPKGVSKEEYLETLCNEGLKKRYPQVTDEIRNRLEFEIKTIKKMGFVGYFLIVWDFINYAKKTGVPVGPGRGSAAGSLVSYLLGITNLDPLKYGLLFERFLNPERLGMPDIDIDFCYERRGEIIDYVTRKYGKEHVAQIITFGTMQARAAIRDVGRVKGAAYGDVDKIAKLIPAELGISIDKALEKEPKIKSLCKENKEAADIIETAKVLEGLTRHASIHAAGVVIGDKSLDEYVPLFKSSDDQITTGFSMKGIADIGLLKMDFLGLRTLTVISKALKLIKQRHNIDLDFNTISLDDQNTFDLLANANSFGVFQLESAGMRDLLRKLKPTEFEDIIAVLALYRPGPMGSGMLDDFIKRKRGEVSFEYDHPKLEPILKETYGIIVYQEQVMKIPVALAGFSLTQADHLRRAMSKKIQAVMDKMRKAFVAGCQERSQINEQKANKLFDLIDYFSGYGFNRSHSAAYALISYQTAYLKANYPVEFMCAILNSEMNNTDKLVEYVKEAEKIGIKISPAGLNESIKEFNVINAKGIKYGLLAVKNVGSTAIDSIVEKRGLKKYLSLDDLCQRVDLRLVNKKVLESLIKCGAMDSFTASRSQLMASVEKSIERASKAQKEKASGQFSFFELAPETSGFKVEPEDYPQVEEWPENQKLAYEKEVLGFYISGHPLMHYKIEISEFTDISTKDLLRKSDGDNVKLVCLINQVKLTNTRKTNARMAILKMEDIEGEVEAVIFPSAYEKLADMIQAGEVFFVNGKVNYRDEEPKIIIEDMRPISDVYRSIKAINLDLFHLKEKKLGRLKEKLMNFPGETPVYLRLKTNTNKGVQILVGKELFVSPEEELIDQIKELIGKDCLSLTL